MSECGNKYRYRGHRLILVMNISSLLLSTNPPSTRLLYKVSAISDADY